MASGHAVGDLLASCRAWPVHEVYVAFIQRLCWDLQHPLQNIANRRFAIELCPECAGKLQFRV